MANIIAGFEDKEVNGKLAQIEFANGTVLSFAQNSITRNQVEMMIFNKDIQTDSVKIHCLGDIIELIKEWPLNPYLL